MLEQVIDIYTDPELSNEEEPASKIPKRSKSDKKQEVEILMMDFKGIQVSLVTQYSEFMKIINGFDATNKKELMTSILKT